MLVYVISKDGHPLMPTERCGKVRRLLRDKKARVVKRCPFTIQLLYIPDTDIVQKCTLGVDTGSAKIGTAVYSKGRILYQSEITIRNDISKKMEARRGARRNRRNRKTRYRKARFLNRKNSIKTNRLPPTLISKINSHIREIEQIKKILPITEIVLETAKFDTTLLKNVNAAFNRHWGYQKGQNYGFANTKCYVLARDNYTCQICGKKHVRLEVHHIVFRSQGGSDESVNLITLCEECHKKLHNGLLNANLIGKRKSNLRYATHMSIIRQRLLAYYPNAIETYGYMTKANRENLQLGKDHYLDACVIASNGLVFKQDDVLYKKRHVNKGDYQLCKGVRGEKRIPTSKMHGFRKYDKVEYLGKEYFIKGRRTAGTCVLMDIDNIGISFNHMPRGYKCPKMRNLIRVASRKTTLCIIERRSAFLCSAKD